MAEGLQLSSLPRRVLGGGRSGDPGAFLNAFISGVGMSLEARLVGHGHILGRAG